MAKIQGSIKHIKLIKEGINAHNKPYKLISIKLSDGLELTSFDNNSNIITNFKNNDNVEIEYQTAGKYLNITNINKLDNKAINIITPDQERQIKIMRQSCLGYANSLIHNWILIDPSFFKSYVEKEGLLKTTKDTADKLLRYVEEGL